MSQSSHTQDFLNMNDFDNELREACKEADVSWRLSDYYPAMMQGFSYLGKEMRKTFCEKINNMPTFSFGCYDPDDDGDEPI